MLTVIIPESSVQFKWRCFRCGECCRASSCGFGEYDREARRCTSLTVMEEHDGYVLYGCAIHDEIVKDPTSRCSPAFGAGCCRTLFNPSRRNIMDHFLPDLHPDHVGVPLGADEDTINDAIDAWHNGKGYGVTLHDYLGWTWEEYAHYVENG